MDKYRGYEIKYIGGGFELWSGGFKIETHQTVDDAATKRYKAMEAIDKKFKDENKDIQANIQRVDAQTKNTRDNGC